MMVLNQPYLKVWHPSNVCVVFGVWRFIFLRFTSLKDKNVPFVGSIKRWTLSIYIRLFSLQCSRPLGHTPGANPWRHRLHFIRHVFLHFMPDSDLPLVRWLLQQVGPSCGAAVTELSIQTITGPRVCSILLISLAF